MSETKAKKASVATDDRAMQQQGTNNTTTDTVAAALQPAILAPAGCSYNFPFVLHQFITETGKTHPNVVGWSKCGSWFYIRHTGDNDALLSRLIQLYFRRECVYIASGIVCGMCDASWLVQFLLIIACLLARNDRRKLQLAASTMQCVRLYEGFDLG